MQLVSFMSSEIYCLVGCLFYVGVFIWRYVFQSRRVTGLHCPCRNDVHTGGFKLASDLEAFGNFLCLESTFKFLIIMKDATKN